MGRLDNLRFGMETKAWEWIQHHGEPSWKKKMGQSREIAPYEAVT